MQNPVPVVATYRKMLASKALSTGRMIVWEPFRRGFGIVQSRWGDSSPAPVCRTNPAEVGRHGI